MISHLPPKWLVGIRPKTDFIAESRRRKNFSTLLPKSCNKKQENEGSIYL